MKRIGKIDPILKVRIDNNQHQIDYIDDTYALNEKYLRSYLAMREALINQRVLLVAKIAWRGVNVPRIY